MHLELSPDLGATWVAAACDANGKLQTAAGGGGGLSVTQGAAIGTSLTPVGGKDGSGNAQFVATDTAGRQVVVGPAVEGGTLVGAPVVVGVRDGGTGQVALWGSNQGDGISGGTRVPSVLGYLFNGATLDRPRTPNTFKTLAALSVTAGTPQAGWTPTSGKKFRLMGFMLSLSVAGAVILKDSGTEVVRTCLMAAGAGLASPRMGNGILSAAANNVLNIDVTATGTVSGFLFGCEE
jgi:hypothetical protein